LYTAMESNLPDMGEEQAIRFGIFDISSRYFTGDWVTHDGHLYMAWRDTQGETPGVVADAWSRQSISSWNVSPETLITTLPHYATNSQSMYNSYTSDTYTSGSGEYTTEKVQELRETVEQLRRELNEIKQRLNTAETHNNVESYRKIAVQ